MWIIAAKESELKNNQINSIFPKGKALIIIKKGADLFCLSAVCSHMGCSLAGALLDDYIIQCPCHDWRFDIRTGEFLDATEIKLAAYKTKIQDGNVLVELK